MNVYRKNPKTPLPGFVVRAHLRQKMFSAFSPRGRSLTTLTGFFSFLTTYIPHSAVPIAKIISVKNARGLNGFILEKININIEKKKILGVM